MVLEEYKAVRSEIKERLAWQVSAMRMWMTFVVAFISGILFFVSEGAWWRVAELTLLSFPAFACLFAMGVAYNYNWIHLLTRYEATDLHDRLKRLAGTDETLLGLDAFYQEYGGTRGANRLTRFASVLDRGFVFLLFGVPTGASLLALALRTFNGLTNGGTAWPFSYFLLLGIDMILLVSATVWGVETFKKFQRRETKNGLASELSVKSLDFQDQSVVSPKTEGLGSLSLAGETGAGRDLPESPAANTNSQ